MQNLLENVLNLIFHNDATIECKLFVHQSC